MKTNIQINQKLIKRKILELARTKKELNVEKSKNMAEIIKVMKPKLPTDILTKKMIMEEYNLHEKKIYRMRVEKGLKSSKAGLGRCPFYIVRKDLEDFLLKDKYDK